MVGQTGGLEGWGVRALSTAVLHGRRGGAKLARGLITCAHYGEGPTRTRLPLCGPQTSPQVLLANSRNSMYTCFTPPQTLLFYPDWRVTPKARARNPPAEKRLQRTQRLCNPRLAFIGCREVGLVLPKPQQ